MEAATGSHDADVNLVVRTVNTKQEDEQYPKRLEGIAGEFFADWPKQAGVIGMQEVKTNMDRCPFHPADAHGADCFARIMKNTYSLASASAVHRDPLGIVAAGDWEITASDNWELGKDDIGHLGARSTRYLLEATVRDRTKGWAFRMYTTHLSHGDQLSQRHDELDKIVDHILSRNKIGEMPPILVGDFNFQEHEEPDSYAKLNRYFWLVNDAAWHCLGGQPVTTGIDQIWVGRYESFPHRESLKLIRFHTGAEGNGIVLKSPKVVDGVSLPRLTDHNSPGASFKVIRPRYEVIVRTGDVENAGTDARVYLMLFGYKGKSGELYLNNPGINDMERNTESLFYFDEPDLGTLDQIRIRHDDSGKEPGWYLKEVQVNDLKASTSRVFPCNRWLAHNQADGKADLTFGTTGCGSRLHIARPGPVKP